MELQQLIKDYLLRTELYRKQGTYDYYVKVSKSIIRGLKHIDCYKVSDITKQTRDNLIMYFKNETIKKNSQINADMSFFYTVLNYYSVKSELLPFEKLPDDTTSFRALNDATLKKLLRYLDKLDITETNYLSWKLAITLMLETGVRMNELLNIKTKNVDYASGTILLETTKNGKKRIVFFNQLSDTLIKKVIKNNNEYIMWNYVKNERMNRVSLFYFFNKIEKHLDLQENKITAHRLRKTFATRLLRNGCPITTIQKLLGHTDIKMTMVYLEIDNTMVEKDYLTYYPYRK